MRDIKLDKQKYDLSYLQEVNSWEQKLGKLQSFSFALASYCAATLLWWFSL